MKKFFGEFKQFIARGNVMDLAVAVIIGGAFGKITTSLVNDIIMPLISAVFGLFGLKGGVQGMSLVLNNVPKYIIDTATGASLLNPEAILWNYGNFIQTILDFLLISVIIFLMIKTMNAANKEFGELMNHKSPFTKEEIKALKKEGKTRKEIKQLETDKAMELKRIADEAAVEAQKNAPPSTEKLLEQIRDLLKTKNEKSE